VTLVDLLGMPCPLKSEKVICCYRPEEDDYVLVASKSALMGTPETKEMPVSVVNFAGCGITHTKQSLKVFPCDSEPTIHISYPDLVSVPIVTSVQDSTSGLVINYGTVAVCQANAGGYNMIPYTQCYEVPVTCSGYCEYEWFGASWEDPFGIWILVTQCENPECACPTPADRPIMESDVSRTVECGSEPDPLPPPEPPEPDPCPESWTVTWSGVGGTPTTWNDPNGFWLITTDCPVGCKASATELPAPTDSDSPLIRSYKCTVEP
jgi:hypothetical protein